MIPVDTCKGGPLGVRYADEDSALDALDAIDEVEEPLGIHERSIYRCPACKGWHVTVPRIRSRRYA